MVGLRFRSVRPYLFALMGAAFSGGGCAQPSEMHGISNKGEPDAMAPSVKKDGSSAPPVTEKLDAAAPVGSKDTALVTSPDTAVKPVDAAPKPADAAPIAVDAAPKPMDTAPAPTWTEIYNSYFGATADKNAKKVGCKGSECHDKSHDGWIFTSKAQAYKLLITDRGFVSTMDPEQSALFSVIPDRMPPQDWPQLTPTDIARIKAWIGAGAKDN